MALKYGQTSDINVEGNTYNFKLGHVERVFTSKNDIQILTDVKGESQLIKFTNVESLESTKTEFYAVPLLRGINDSITRGDLIMFTNLGGKYFYLGPINTKNVPYNSADHTYNPSKLNRYLKFDTRKDKPDGYNRNIPDVAIPKLSKPRYNLLDYPGRPSENINPSSIEYAESNFSDLTLEGRYGNAIRIGARNQFPQLMISNNNVKDIETLGGGGSIFAMTSIGSIVENFPLDRNFRLASDIKISEESEDQYKGFLLDFNYDYGKIKLVDGDEEQSEFDQIIISSDRMIFNSIVEDITLSSNRGIKIGAAGNIEMTNKGYSVFESRNIYIGKKAKDRSEPMVLGGELRRLLVRILRVLGDAEALGDYNIPQPLSLFPSELRANTVREEVDSIMKEFNLGGLVPGEIPESPDPGYQPNIETDENGNITPVGDRSTGNATFFSQHHFIETNRE